MRAVFSGTAYKKSFLPEKTQRYDHNGDCAAFFVHTSLTEIEINTLSKPHEFTSKNTARFNARAIFENLSFTVAALVVANQSRLSMCLNQP